MDKKHVAVYAGTFDPLTRGHECIIRRATQLFGRVVVAVAKDCAKTPIFSLEERVEIVRETFAENPSVEAVPFTGLLVDFARDMNACAIIRGLRAVSDFDYEFQMALMNNKLEPGIQTIFLMPELKWMYISSTNIRNVAALGGDVSELVPPNVIPRLRRVFRQPPISGNGHAGTVGDAE